MKLGTILQKFWALLLLPPTLLGIWYFPSDLIDSQSSEVSRPWLDFLALLSREALLWLVCLGLATWIIWSEFRPYMRSALAKKPSIKVQPNLYFESDILSAHAAYRVRVFLVVCNETKDRRTLRNVGALFSMIGAPTSLTLRRSDNSRTDIRHGEMALFEIGSFIYGESVGLPMTNTLPPDKYEKNQIEHNLALGHLKFKIGRGDDGMIGQSTQFDSSDFPYFITLSADDTPSTVVRVNMMLPKLPDAESAFRLEVI